MIRSVLPLVLLAALAACQPTATTVAPVSDPAPAPAAPQASGLVALVSAQRAARGQSAVTADARLSAAAQAHAEDMARNGYFSHQGRNGSSFSQRARAAGYACAIAENIAAGQQSEAAVMQTWMASEGHRRNILLPNAREIGIGRAGAIWVLMFGSGC